MEKLVSLQSVDLRIQEMEKARDEIPQRIAVLEDQLKKEEDAGRRLSLSIHSPPTMVPITAKSPSSTTRSAS